jgi:hypothetical protein
MNLFQDRNVSVDHRPGYNRTMKVKSRHSFWIHSLCLATLVLAPNASRAADMTLAEAQAGALKGDAEAEFALGRAFNNGTDIPRDYVQAMEWYRKASDQGNAKAENNIGSMYNHGLGVKRDPVEAAKWYRKAAEQGAALAQLNLATMLARGTGTPKNIKEAAQWYQKAAEQGLPEAQLELGKLYNFGDVGFDKNYRRPNGWRSPLHRVIPMRRRSWVLCIKMAGAFSVIFQRLSHFFKAPPTRAILWPSAALA